MFLDQEIKLQFYILRSQVNNKHLEYRLDIHDIKGMVISRFNMAVISLLVIKYSYWMIY